MHCLRAFCLGYLEASSNGDSKLHDIVILSKVFLHQVIEGVDSDTVAENLSELIPGLVRVSQLSCFHIRHYKNSTTYDN